MPRYYFHVQGPKQQLRDEVGVVLPDGEAAWYQAVRSARDLIRADLALGCGYEEHAIEIADDKGMAVNQVPLREIARYAL
jgi:hypothetical protein